MQNKISLFTRFPNCPEVNQLKKTALTEGTKLEVITLKSAAQADEIIPSLGAVIIWRSSYLNHQERTVFLKNAVKNHFLINKAILETPLVKSKLYQQKVLKACPYLKEIPTYTNLKSLNRNLHFPFIAKPNIGSQGKRIFLIKNQNDLNNFQKLRKGRYIFQNFIKNKGDYRVLVLGGKVLGIMKRVSASPKEFRNNISQGEKSLKVTDEKTRKILTDIALKAAALFNLYFTDVDIIYNEEEKKYQVLEVNTVPQWQGLQKITSHNIAAQIIKESQHLAKRKKESTDTIVKNYYNDFSPFLNHKKFHYFSKIFLWSQDKKALQNLNAIKNNYIGKNREETVKKLNQILKDSPLPLSSYPLEGKAKLRYPYSKKYPRLKKYLSLLLKNIFANTIYQQDLRPIIIDLVSDQDFLNLYHQLIKDEKAIQAFSTSAINYFYSLRYYLRKTDYKPDFDPQRFLKIAKQIDHQKNRTKLALKIYLLTHCIIGESYFYSRAIIDKKETYLQIIKELEKLIKENFLNISLDNKLEFLVCANILNYDSILKKPINKEAEKSLSNLGNFLVDQHNTYTKELGTKIKNNFIKAEHRNVLYLISDYYYPPNFSPYHPKRKA